MDGIFLVKRDCEATDCVLGKKVRNIAKNISENAICLMERRSDLYRNYLRDGSYKSKRNVKKLEKA